jgi:transcription antitermination factor NusG
MASRWYVIHVYSGFEKKVAASIREQAEQKGLAESFEEILVPTEEVVEVKRGSKVSSERKFFPGYVLIKMDLSDETWHLVKNTAKVTGFHGGRGRPSPISDTGRRACAARQEGDQAAKTSSDPESESRSASATSRSANSVGSSGSRRREGADQGCGVDLRACDPGRARIFAGRKGLTLNRS